MYLIGIHGQLHSGKDTAFQFLSDQFSELRFKRVAFADKIKISAMRSLGFINVDDAECVAVANAMKDTYLLHVRDEDGPVWTITFRKFLQHYGAEGHRDVFSNDDFWIDMLLPFANTSLNPYERAYENGRELRYMFPNVDVLIVTDVRFPNEVTRILGLGGEVWKLDASKRLTSTDTHASERLLPDEEVTRIVENNTELAYFREHLIVAFNDMVEDAA